MVVFGGARFWDVIGLSESWVIGVALCMRFSDCGLLEIEYI